MTPCSQPRKGRWARLRARPALLLVVGGSALAAVAVVLVWFQPQALLFDTVVDEEFPAPASEPPSAGDDALVEDDSPTGGDSATGGEPPGEAEEAPPPEAHGPMTLSRGGFESRGRYTVTGEAAVYALEDGSRTLRLEPFESTNGPDLLVYLTAADQVDDDDALDDDFVDLGLLKGNIGHQNYDIPDGVDLDRYDTVVIWCRRFTVAFGAADLVAVGDR